MKVDITKKNINEFLNCVNTLNVNTFKDVKEYAEIMVGVMKEPPEPEK